MRSSDSATPRPNRLDIAAAAMRATPVGSVPADVIQATSRALRDAVQDRSKTQVAQPWMNLRRLAIACVLLAVISLVFALSQSTTRPAFAEIAQQVGATKTLRATIVDDREGGILSASGTRRRMESAHTIAIADSATGQEISLDLKNRQAYRIPQRGAARALDFYRLIRELATAVATPIDDYVDPSGRRYPGLAGRASLDVGAPEPWKVDARVWSDPATKLPIRVEIAGAGDADEPLILDQIAFDVPLAESLFDMTIPADFAVVGKTADELQPPPTKDEAARLTITPEGLGEVKYGMTRDQIVAILGEPEFVQFDVYLNYPSKGLQLNLTGPAMTLGMIVANPHDAANLTRHEFPGQTDRGIRIGSPRAEVIAAYGPADPPLPSDRPGGPDIARYEKLRLMFTFGNGKVAQIFANAPPMLEIR